MQLDSLLIYFIDSYIIQVTGQKRISTNYILTNIHCSCRRKTGNVAGSFPDYLSLGRHRHCINPCWRGDHEAVLPNSVWPTLLTESHYDGRVVLGVHFLGSNSFPTSKSQFNRWSFTHRWGDRDNVLYHVVGSLCQPTTTTNSIL